MDRKFDLFVAQYEANYGSFPIVSGEKGKLMADFWRKWLEKVPTTQLDLVFKQISEQRKKTNERFKPRLEMFERAWEAVKNEREAFTDSYKSKEEKAAEALMKLPLFDFAKDGFPLRREAFLIELPSATVKRFNRSWEEMTTRKITSQEFKDRMEEEGWYLPEWDDYDRGKKEMLCKRWKIPLPKEEELPF